VGVVRGIWREWESNVGHIERKIPRGVQQWCSEQLREQFTPGKCERVAIIVDFLLAAQPLTEVQGYRCER
jgi:hypothetical protein